jgi:hypothetical protein
MLSDWRERHVAMRTVRCVVTGSSTAFKGSLSNGRALQMVTGLTGEFPTDDRRTVISRTYLIDRPAGFHRKEEDRDVFHGNHGKFYRQYQVNLFDGEKLQTWRPKGRTDWRDIPRPELETELHLDPLKDLPSFYLASDAPFFLAHAWFLEVAAQQYGIVLKPSPADRQEFTIGKPGVLDGKEVQVVYVDPPAGGGDTRLELWVDAGMDSAIRRCVELRAGSPVRQTNLRYTEVNGRYQISAWDWVSFGANGAPNSAEEMEVVEYQQNGDLEPSYFRIEPTPGMVVFDGSTGEHYLVESPNGSRVSAVEAVEASRGKRIPWMPWAAVAAVLTGCLWAGARFYRGRRARTAVLNLKRNLEGGKVI